MTQQEATAAAVRKELADLLREMARAAKDGDDPYGYLCKVGSLDAVQGSIAFLLDSLPDLPVALDQVASELAGEAHP